MSDEDRALALGQAALGLVMLTSFALFSLTVTYEFNPVLLLIGSVEALLLYFVHQGATWARSSLILIFCITAAELLFAGYENLAPGDTLSSFTLGRVLGYAASCVLLLRPSVTTFMRQQRITKLMPNGDAKP